MQTETSNSIDARGIDEQTSSMCGSETVLRLQGLCAHIHEERDSAGTVPGPGIAQILALRVGCWQPPLYIPVPLPAAS